MADKKRTRNPEAKRQAIMAAALSEMSELGFAGSRTDSLAKKADVSVGTIYKIFGSKEKLANAVYQDCLFRIQEKIQAALKDEPDAYQAFCKMWKEYSHFFFNDTETLFFFEYQLHDSFLDETSRKGRQQLRNGLLKWIEQNIEHNIFKQYPTELLRSVAIGSILRLLRESRDRNIKVRKKDMAELRELVWESISA